MLRSIRVLVVTWVAALVALAGCGSEGPPPGPTAQQLTCLDVLDALTMPFQHQGDAGGLEVRGADGSYAPLVFGPWGAHNSPHTGHIAGNGKADMMGVLAHGAAEMSALDGGECTSYEPGSPNCGLPHADALARRSQYRLPDAFSAELLAAMEEHDITYRVREVVVNAKGQLGSQEWQYADSPDHWQVVVEICGYTYSFGHSGALGPALRTALTERGVTVDFDDFDGSVGVNLVQDLDPRIELAPGTIVSYPQIVGAYLPAGDGQTEAYITPLPNNSHIWAQIEFATFRYDVLSGDGYLTPSYALLEPAELDIWQAALLAEMNDPSSVRYGSDLIQAREWLWRAEGFLLHTPEFDVNNLERHPLRGLGDWWESYEGCGVADVRCNEVISFNRIDRDADAFDPSFYEAESRYLLWWLRTGATPYDGYYGEVLSASGDLEADASGTFVVRWRDFNGGAPIDATPHQALAYSIGDDDVMRLRWGARAADAGSVVVPAVPTADEACDGTTLTCHMVYNEFIRRENIEGQL